MAKDRKKGNKVATRQAGNALAGEMTRVLALFGAGQWSEAETAARDATRKHPAHPFGWKALGAILAKTGRSHEAVDAMQRALELSPSDPELRHNLIHVLARLGSTDEVERQLRLLIKLAPNDAEAHRKLGNLLLESRNFSEAVSMYRRVLDINPAFVGVHNNLGLALRSLSRFEEAEPVLRRALELQPDHPNSAINLGCVLHALRKEVEAESLVRHYLDDAPDDVNAMCILGSILIRLDRPEEAEALGARALSLSPDSALAHGLVGTALRDRGLIEEAVASFRRARDIAPDSLSYWDSALLLLPQIAHSAESIDQWRARYRAGIAELARCDITWPVPDGVAAGPSFYLAYQNCNDRPILEDLAVALRSRIPAIVHEAPHVAGWRPPATDGRKIRVGFLSMLLFTHTIGKLTQSYIRHLDRSRFEVVLLHLPGALHDAFRRGLDAAADKCVELPRGLAAQQQAVAAQQLDVLFYPDIGMSPESYFLAHGRLAPVQMVTWGHPDTTGLPCVDYFISADSIEPEGAECHYTEHLIRMDRLPSCYQPQMAPSRILTREALGLPPGVRLYGCPQSLFKFHPDFDAVLDDIARLDPDGRIVVLRTKNKFEAQLLSRWERMYPNLAERVLMLSRLDLAEFMALLAHMDVLLDPIHFGSGNTLYEAMVYGTPIVTWPGQFMRGRIVAGAYHQMKVADPPVAARLEDYAPLAVSLARDEARRAELGRRLRDAAARELFSDMGAVRELEILLEEAVAAAGRGSKLPSGWCPG